MVYKEEFVNLRMLSTNQAINIGYLLVIYRFLIKLLHLIDARQAPS